MLPGIIPDAGFFAAAVSGGMPATSYANARGSGNRTSLITVTASGWTQSAALSGLVDGSTAVAVWFSNAPGAGTYLQFDFGVQVYLDEITAVVGAGYTSATFKWQGGDGTTFVDLKTGIQLASLTNVIPITAYLGLYQIFRLVVTAGTVSSNYHNEFTFKVSA